MNASKPLFEKTLNYHMLGRVYTIVAQFLADSTIKIQATAHDGKATTYSFAVGMKAITYAGIVQVAERYVSQFVVDHTPLITLDIAPFDRYKEEAL